MASVEQLEQAIRELVSERQALRDVGADRNELEQNRLRLIRLQGRLTEELLERHLPADPGTGRGHGRARRRALPAGAAALAAGVLLAFLTGVAGAVGESSSSAVSPRASASPRFAHVMVVVLENKPASAIVGNPAASVFNGLARRYALLANYHAVAHPSLPNYLALISGTTGGLRRDCLDCSLAAPTIAQTLDAAGETWKAYVEGVRRNGFGDIDSHAVKARIPFLYSQYVLGHPGDMKRIVPLAELAPDLRRGDLPTYSLVVPSLCHDMHNCSVRTGDRWLGSFVSRVLPALGPRDVVFVVFDESHMQDMRGGGGHVAALALGPLVRRGSVSHAPLDHYGLLRTIEHGLGLPPLGQSANAAPYRRDLATLDIEQLPEGVRYQAGDREGADGAGVANLVRTLVFEFGNQHVRGAVLVQFLRFGVEGDAFG